MADLTPLWRRRPHFRMPSIEAPMSLPTNQEACARCGYLLMVEWGICTKCREPLAYPRKDN